MLDSTSLIMTSDRTLVKLLREQVRSEKIAGFRLIVGDSADEACSLLQSVRIKLVLVQLEAEHIGYDEVDHLLWVASTLRQRIPIVVMAERYIVEQATTFYRMGVNEYISRSHHLDQLGAIVAAYLHHGASVGSDSATDLVPAEPARVAASRRASAAIPAPAF
jgi:DNA-binding NtrC family response regulator